MTHLSRAHTSAIVYSLLMFTQHIEAGGCRGTNYPPADFIIFYYGYQLSEITQQLLTYLTIELNRIQHIIYVP